jgi:nucleotide-binding universal stress UspA family protein
MTAPAARALRHSPDRRSGLVVDGGAVPEWVLRWCGRTGRTVRARTAQATADAGRTGDSVLVLRADPLAGRPRIVAALRALPDDAAVLADAIDAAVHLRGSLTLVHAVPLSFGERSVGLSDALHRGECLLLDARALGDAAGVDAPVDTRLVRAWPHELVGEQLHANLLAIGGPRAGAEGVGLVAATAVRHAPCPVLLAARPAAPWSDLLADPARTGQPRIPMPRTSVESTAGRAC